MRYGLVTGVQLFEAVEKALEKDEAAASAFRERLLNAEGALPLDEAGQRAEDKGHRT